MTTVKSVAIVWYWRRNLHIWLSIWFCALARQLFDVSMSLPTAVYISLDGCNPYGVHSTVSSFFLRRFAHPDANANCLSVMSLPLNRLFFVWPTYARSRTRVGFSIIAFSILLDLCETRLFSAPSASPCARTLNQPPCTASWAPK